MVKPASLRRLPAFVRHHYLVRFGKENPDIEKYTSGHEPEPNVQHAHMVTSLDPDTMQHRPILDLDFPAALVPSTTPGHFHLYLDKPMAEEDYFHPPRRPGSRRHHRTRLRERE